MKKIKVLNVIYTMGAGGAQQVILNYLRDFKDDPDIECMLCVFTAPTNSKYDEAIKNEHYNVRYLNEPKTKFPIPYVRRFFQRRVTHEAWTKAIGEMNPDIIHVHISGLLDSVLPAIVANKIPVRFDTLHSSPYRYRGREKYAIVDAFCNHGVIPICLTSAQVQEAKDWYGITNYEVVRNGVDIHQIQQNMCSKQEARKVFDIQEDAFVVIGVGRLHPVKRFDLLIEAFAEVCRSRTNARLLIAGDGEEKENLLQQVKKRGLEQAVTFLGDIPDATQLYCAADVLAVTSHTEASSLVAIEAQACGTRCVLSAGVPRESILLKNTQRLQPDATKMDWCEALLEENTVTVPDLSLEDYEVHNASQKMREVYLKYYSMHEKSKHLDAK